MAVTGGEAPDLGTYCREIEAHLCRRNGGHLIRIAGPAFVLVSSWYERGVPLKVVFRGIDRLVERRHDRGVRRPARIEFCEADVLGVFDDWRRAVGRLAGVTIGGAGDLSPDAGAENGLEEDVRRRGPSLPSHIERIQVRLTSLLAGERFAESLRRLLEDTVRTLDVLRAQAPNARGSARERLLAGLRDLDARLVEGAWTEQDEAAAAALRSAAADELALFRGRMSDEAWQVSIDAAARRLLRERLGLPTLALD